MPEYSNLVESIKEFEGLDYNTEYDLTIKGEKLTIIIETNFQAYHHNHGSLMLETQTTYKTTYTGGDLFKINYYLDGSKFIEKIVSPYSSYFMSKSDLLDTLDFFKHEGLSFHESE